MYYDSDYLIIEYVKSDCLCTSFKLSTDTIRKDEEFFLELKFNSSGKTGSQAISTIIKSNSKERLAKLLPEAMIK